VEKKRKEGRKADRKVGGQVDREGRREGEKERKKGRKAGRKDREMQSPSREAAHFHKSRNSRNTYLNLLSKSHRITLCPLKAGLTSRDQDEEHSAYLVLLHMPCHQGPCPIQ